MNQPSSRMAGQDWLLLVILSLLWAGSFVFYKVLATELPPLTTVFGRVGIGALAMLMFLRARGIPRTVPRPMIARFFILATLASWSRARFSCCRWCWCSIRPPGRPQ